MAALCEMVMARDDSAYRDHPGLGAHRLHVSHTWIPLILAVMAHFSLFHSTHNHYWEQWLTGRPRQSPCG